MTVANNTVGTGVMTVNIATYKSNPTMTTIFNAGAFYDLQVLGADPTDTVEALFYYPSTVTGAAETALQLQYWNGVAWAPVSTSGGAAPAKDTTDNLDSTISGGRFSVLFDNTSTPTITQLTGTVFTVAPVATEAAIQFDPATQDIVVVRQGDGPASIRTAPSTWGAADEAGTRDRGKAELRTYVFNDPGRGTLTVVVNVKKAAMRSKPASSPCSMEPPLR